MDNLAIALPNSGKLFGVNCMTLLFISWHDMDVDVVVHLSDFVPRLSLFPANLPYVVDTFCRYPFSNVFLA